MKNEINKKGQFIKGITPWNKGIKHTEEAIEKMKINKRKNSHNDKRWKGDNAKKATIHDWVRIRKGRPSQYICEICKKKKAEDWSNKDHKYKRNINDYWPLCRKCHRQYDREHNIT